MYTQQVTPSIHRQDAAVPNVYCVIVGHPLGHLGQRHHCAIHRPGHVASGVHGRQHPESPQSEYRDAGQDALHRHREVGGPVLEGTNP